MPSITDFFGLTRVINLADRKDRLREITRQLHGLGSTFQPNRVELYAATRPTELAGFPSLGAYGCFLSHLAVLKDARARNVSSLLVIEDDLEVSPEDIPALTSIACTLTPTSWGILHLGHILPLPGVTEPRLTPVPSSEIICNAHFYAVNAPVFDPLIEYLEGCLNRPPGDPIGGPMHFDGALTMFRAAHPAILTLVAQPSLGGQRSSRSDISFRKFDTIPVLREVISFARVAKRTLRPRAAATAPKLSAHSQR